jgi:hypothetical protein
MRTRINFENILHRCNKTQHWRWVESPNIP